MGNKPKWNEALSEAMRGQLGTTREVFTNSNGSNVILEKVGDKWHHEIGSPEIDGEEDDEPEDEGEEDEEGEGGGSGAGGGSPPTPGNGGSGAGGSGPGNPGTGKTEANPPHHHREPVDYGIDEGKGNQQEKGKFFNGTSNAKNEKIKNVYDEMKAQIDKQLEHYYKTGKFTIDPTQMMNKVFHDIMGKYGYKSIFNNWFKDVAQKRAWVKKAYETWQKVNPAKLTKKLTGKLTVENIGKFLKLKQTTINKLSHVFKLGKLLKTIRGNPVKFIVDAFSKTGAMSADMTSLVSAFGSADAGDLLSYVITLLIT